MRAAIPFLAGSADDTSPWGTTRFEEKPISEPSERKILWDNAARALRLGGATTPSRIRSRRAKQLVLLFVLAWLCVPDASA